MLRAGRICRIAPRLKVLARVVVKNQGALLAGLVFRCERVNERMRERDRPALARQALEAESAAAVRALLARGVAAVEEGS